jgi:hypothetical protein
MSCWRKFVLVLCVVTFGGLMAPGQSLRMVPVGGGLGHLVHGVGNEPLRLSNDAMAIISDGTTEGANIVDDQLIVVSGFESGLLATSTVSLYTALGSYGDLPRSLARLSDESFVYVDCGAPGHDPSLVVVGDAGGVNLVTVHTLPREAAFDIDEQTPAALDSASLVWIAVGRDQVSGTADDRIGFAFGLGQAPSSVGSIAAPGAMGGEVVALSAVRAVARCFGADGVLGTTDDALVLIDRAGRTVTTTVLPLGAGVGAFVHARGPLRVGKDSLVYPTAGTGATSLYTLVRAATSSTPEIFQVGSPLEVPPASAFRPEPVAIGRDFFTYFNAGANRSFHDSDDEIRVCVIGATIQVRTFAPNVALGLSDTSIPPVCLELGRAVFPSRGADGLAGTADDGVVFADDLDSTSPVFSTISTGVEALSIARVNGTSVAMMTLDGSLGFVQGIGTYEPWYTQFVQSVGCGSCFKRLNDWTLVGTNQVSTESSNLIDDIVTVQFPFVEILGSAQTCASGHSLVISRDVPPVLGTTWPAVVSGGDTGAPAALMLSWYPADLPLNPAARFYLDPAFVFGAEVMIVDVSGAARVHLYLEPLPWLPGYSFCGQWGMYDPAGYDGLCVSSGFRVHF